METQADDIQHMNFTSGIAPLKFLIDTRGFYLVVRFAFNQVLDVDSSFIEGLNMSQEAPRDGNKE